MRAIAEIIDPFAATVRIVQVVKERHILQKKVNDLRLQRPTHQYREQNDYFHDPWIDKHNANIDDIDRGLVHSIGVLSRRIDKLDKELDVLAEEVASWSVEVVIKQAAVNFFYADALERKNREYPDREP